MNTSALRNGAKPENQHEREYQLRNGGGEPPNEAEREWQRIDADPEGAAVYLQGELRNVRNEISGIESQTSASDAAAETLSIEIAGLTGQIESLSGLAPMLEYERLAADLTKADARIVTAERSAKLLQSFAGSNGTGLPL